MKKTYQETKREIKEKTTTGSEESYCI